MIPALYTPAGLRKLVAESAKDLGDLIYPVQCLGCNSRAARRRIPICESCYRGIERVEPTDMKLPQGSDPHDSPCVVMWYYDPESPVRRLHHALKYDSMYQLGHWIGRVLGMEILDSEGDHLPGCDSIVPVPLHRVRFLERGFNQAEALAEGVSQTTGIPVERRALRRSRHTPSQTSLDHESRVQNVQDAFQVSNADLVRDRNILLIDDVITTGATVSSAVSTLRDAGARSCTVAALAIVRSPGSHEESTGSPPRRPGHRTTLPRQDRSSR